MQTINAIGLMSGSSLDGLDICYVQFSWNENKTNPTFQYQILQTDYFAYNDAFRQELKNAPNLNGFQLAQLHTTLGKQFGQLTKQFIHKHQIKNIDFIASHGQTIFHQPNLGVTTQIGCGASIAAITNCKTICDFRTSDIANNGQGAPIVPIVEKYLFHTYNAFLNIGGIANIAIHQHEKIIGYDICAANTVLNYLANQLNKDFDKDGTIARTGLVNNHLLQQLNNIPFIQQAIPKSLGTEHVLEYWIKIINQTDIVIADKLATMVEHIAYQVNKAIENTSVSQLFITGGGALNSFLVERIQANITIPIEIPSKAIINYKEALAIAFIGLLRYIEIPNVLASVTGASKNNIGGAIYLP